MHGGLGAESLARDTAGRGARSGEAGGVAARRDAAAALCYRLATSAFSLEIGSAQARHDGGRR